MKFIRLSKYEIFVFIIIIWNIIQIFIFIIFFVDFFLLLADLFGGIFKLNLGLTGPMIEYK